jgi:hypothetical protein
MSAISAGSPMPPLIRLVPKCVPQLVWGDVQQLPVAAAQSGGGDRVEQALAQPE